MTYLNASATLITIVAAALVAACSSAPDVAAPAPETSAKKETVKTPPPPTPETLDDTLALANELPICVKDQAFSIRTRTSAEAGNKPVLTNRCIPKYPDILEKNGYVAACYTAFNITDDGLPSGIVVKCNTDNAFGRDDPAEWEIAHAITLRIIYRAMSEMRFEPPGEELPLSSRENVVQPIRFEMEGMEGFPAYPPMLWETLERPAGE